MAHYHEVSYPERFPMPCVTSAVAILRGGRPQIVAERQTLALDIYNVQGFAQRIAFGVPEAPLTDSEGSAFGIDDEEGVTRNCRELCIAAGTALGLYVDDHFGAIDWRVDLEYFIKNILPVLIPLIFNDDT